MISFLHLTGCNTLTKTIPVSKRDAEDGRITFSTTNFIKL